jgi:hypothetical protein
MSGSFAPPSTAAPGGVIVYTESIAFTSRDTYRRQTISNGLVTSTSKIIGNIRRPDNTNATDRGYIYSANVVSQGTGTFDVAFSVTEEGESIIPPFLPNETLTYAYIIL